MGGVHPSENKLSCAKPIEVLPLPDVVTIPLAQHIGAPAVAKVAKGDRVLTGQLIAEAGSFMSANIHSPISGTVTAVDMVVNGQGLRQMMITIKREGDDWAEGIDRSDALVKVCPFSAQEIIAKIKDAGIVGMGGATFPTHVKLSVPPGKKAECVIINGVECEPYLTSDHRTMLEHGEELVVGVTILMKAVGVGKAYIGIENNKPDAIAHLTKIAAGYKGIEVVPLKVMYPQGGEKQLIAAVTGRQVPPPPALPIDVGAVVCNASTTVAVYQAVLKNKPLIERVVTVTGKSVKEPKNLLTRMGTPISALIEAGGGLPGDAGKVINGGPMMGSLITSLETPVTKTTGGLLVLPGNHPLIQRRRQDERTLLAIDRTVCEQCRLCTDLCPRHLIGHELSPHLLVRAVNYRQAATPSLLLSALTCSECNVCESVACPVGISPMRINRLLKRELRAKNLRYDGPLRPADEMAKHRLVPVKRLISKLGLGPWDQDAPRTAVDGEVACVSLPLRQHIGISAVPCVAPGERVTRGQLLADIPADALGAPVHASIDGQVSAITEQAITLVRG